MEPALALEVKIACFAEGVRLTPPAERVLTHDSTVPLSIHEYATTGGITLRADDLYVNAPFDRGFPDPDAPILDHDGQGLTLATREGPLRVEALPLPGYLGAIDAAGRRVADAAMSHADRVRISPIGGCAFACEFCDIAGKRYVRRPVDHLAEATRVAYEDPILPVQHTMVSGGTPSPQDRMYLVEASRAVADASLGPVDIMVAPTGDSGWVGQLIEAGMTGFAINLEVFDPALAALRAPQKAKLGHLAFAAAITEAVDLTGGKGRVRSLLVVGLEPLDSLLQGVEFLARLGCDPVLSPFRPALGTRMENAPPPSPTFLRQAFAAGTEIAQNYGVALGPRCIPCSHNTLTVPAGPAYYHSHRGG